MSNWVEMLREDPEIIRMDALAAEIHEGQRTKAGLPYIAHPRAVAMLALEVVHLLGLAPEREFLSAVCQAALLHDSVEDQPERASLESLREQGVAPEVVEAVRCLTHGPNCTSLEYGEAIDAAKGNPIARVVKLADITHNSLLTRVFPLDLKDATRLEQRHVKYLYASLYLAEKISREEFFARLERL